MNAQLCAVLFVDVTGSTRLYEALGDEQAHARIGRRLRRIERAVHENGGRVVKHLGDGLMCAFGEPNTAVRAAHAMQLAAAEQEPGAAVGIHVGCHYGPVLEEDGDLYGDSVNVASRIAGVAKSGQIVITRTVVEGLDEELRARVRELGHATVKGRRERVAILEFVWDDSEDLTVIKQTVVSERTSQLRIVSAGGEQAFDGADGRSLTLGRDASSDVVVADREASRRHAHVERRRAQFVIVDHSANGTYVAIAGESERCLRREELALQSRGRIALGRSTRDPAATVLEFRCDD
jgi:hypothetical protein